MRVDRHRQLRQVLARSSRGLAIQLDQRDETLRFATNDRDDEGKPEPPGANDGVRVAADANPDGQRLLHRARVDAEVVERRPADPGPGDVLVVPELQQEVELLGEQLVVVTQVVAEERERLRE